MKLYDKVTEAALINLHGIGMRNNNKLNLGLIKDEDYAMKFFVEVANMLQFIAPEIKVTINRPNIFSFIIFKTFIYISSVCFEPYTLDIESLNFFSIAIKVVKIFLFIILLILFHHFDS